MVNEQRLTSRTSWLSKKLYEFDLLQLSNAEKQAIYDEIRNNNQMQPGYLLLVLTACMIALLGLLVNSTAVVIGAMLVSPLMNPFLASALALTLGDWSLGRQALRTIVLSVLVAVTISSLVVYFSPLKDVTAEILARTKPNVMDLLIAFFAGFAGTYTLVVRKGSTTIPGVAIATAVMPPLCVTGYGVYYGVYHHEWTIASGAFALFITNLVAIVVSASLVFSLAHYRTEDQYSASASRYGARLRLVASFCLLTIISIPLLYSLMTAVNESRKRNAVEVILQQQIKTYPGVEVEPGWQLQQDEQGQTVITAVLRTQKYLNQGDISKLEQSIAQVLHQPTRLQLSQLRLQAGGFVEPTLNAISSTMRPVTAATPVVESASAHIEGIQEWLEPLLEELEVIFGMKLSSYKLVIGTESASLNLAVEVASDEPLAEGTLAAAQRLLRKHCEKEGFKIGAQQPLITVKSIPVSDPYLIIKFINNESSIDESLRSSLKRLVKYQRQSPELQPILLVSDKITSKKLLKRRKQAIEGILLIEGWDKSLPIREVASDKLAEDEIAFRLISNELKQN